MIVGLSLYLLLISSSISDEASRVEASHKVDQRVNPSTRKNEILRIVRAADGYVTEELHQEFWTLIRLESNARSDLSTTIDNLKNDLIGPSARLGRETWLSARMSLRAGKVVRSDGLNQAIHDASTSVPSEAIAQSIASVDRVLTAAANRTPLRTSDGPIFINEDLISATLAGMEGSVRRLEILLTPDWGLPLEAYEYEDTHVTILAPWPFAHERSELTVQTGQKAFLSDLSRTISPKQMVYVSFSAPIDDRRPSWDDPQGTAIRNIEASLQAVGAASNSVYGENWRGLISATGSGSVEGSGQKLFVSSRSVFVPQHRGFLTFIATSELSLLDSLQLLDELEAQTQLQD